MITDAATIRAIETTAQSAESIRDTLTNKTVDRETIDLVAKLAGQIAETMRSVQEVHQI